ncbi:MYG1 protein [Diorhabda sublineata]|uniref:MYG1 protein n=1 Tax=Diorhabda sublineata TaxID=1163346 RepID=UPI0024E0FC03|nr:MYG1 protein [Diorhabda sublineata]
MALSAKIYEIIRISSGVGTHVWNGFSIMATGPKNPKVSKKIGTHSGVFHCDEALACYMLKQLPEYEDAEIIRTRDQFILGNCDIVVDVGGEYDPKKHRYDHHQRSFEHTISTVRSDLIKNKSIKLSSAGLVYAHFGIEVIIKILEKQNITASSECLRSVYGYIYESFVEELDAIDNGVPMFTEGKPKFRINTHLSARVHRLNPEWNSPNPLPSDEIFYKAMELVGSEFSERVTESVTIWWPAKEIVKKSIENRSKVDKSGEIILIGERCPWKDHLFALEEEMGIVGEIKFVIFNDVGGSWRVQAVPIQPDSFICRVFLHKDWRGVRDDELIEISGIEGSLFCHATGFIGGNKTKEGALQMALRSLSANIADRE